MRSITINIKAGEDIEIAMRGDYLRVKSSAVELRVEAPESGEFCEVVEGEEAFFTGFNRLKLSHSDGANQTVKLIVGNGTRVGSAKVSGLMTVLYSSVEFDQTANTVTNVSGTMIAGNPARKYLMICNNHATGNIWIKFGAGAATTNGIKLPPGGGMWEWNGVQGNNEISAIGDIASNTAIVVVEG